MMYVCMCVGVCDTEKNSVESAPSLPLLWVLGFEHKSPGLHGECFYSLSHNPGCAVFFQNDCHLSMTSEQLWFCCHPRHICRDETCWALGQAGSCSVCSLGSSASVVSPLLPVPQTLLLRCSLWGQAGFGSHSSGQLFETQGNSSFKPLFLSVTWGSGVIAGFSVQAVYSLSETCGNRSVSDFEIFV